MESFDERSAHSSDLVKSSVFFDTILPFCPKDKLAQTNRINKIKICFIRKYCLGKGCL
jgi:hypothetical protein